MSVNSLRSRDAPIFYAFPEDHLAYIFTEAALVKILVDHMAEMRSEGISE